MRSPARLSEGGQGRLAMASAAGALLAAAKQTVAVAESSAGGLVSARLLAVPGASSFFVGGEGSPPCTPEAWCPS